MDLNNKFNIIINFQTFKIKNFPNMYKNPNHFNIYFNLN